MDFSLRNNQDGIVIHSSDDVISSPIEGRIVSVYPSGHAFIVENKSLKVLIHIGIDTFQFHKYYEIIKETGTTIRVGTPVIKINHSILGMSSIDIIIAILDQQKVNKTRKKTSIPK